MEHQKELARAAQKSKEDAGWEDASSELELGENTIFTGYEHLTDTAAVSVMFAGNTPVSELKEGDSCMVVLDRTPFYAESGGQASDIGRITCGSFEGEVQELSLIHI